MTKRKHRRNFLTLLELLLVISLLTLAIGALGIQVPRFLQQESFYKDIERFHQKMALAQEIMVEYNSDLFLTLHLDSEGLHCILRPLGSVAHSVVALANQKNVLATVKEMRIDGIPTQSVSLEFCAATGESTKASLLLKGKYEERLLFLCGHPQKSLKEYPNEAPYPEEATP